MSSISVPCPKCYLISRHGEWCGDLQDQLHQSQMVRVSNPNAPLLAGSTRIPLLKVHNRSRFPIFKAQVQEVTLESINFPSLSSTKLENPSNGKEVEEAKVPTDQATASDSNIISFMAEVSDLVRLVDSRDITELRLKKKDIELIIRKKEVLPQPAPPTHFFMMQPPQQAFFPPQTQSPLAVPPPSPAGPSISASPPALPPPTKGSKSSVPPLKCPMAGTFYRCPGPGEPPFVKVGDKVQKGQVVCIIEAMKLMNEIEADQSGTVVEILVEDGKPVSLDMPLFIIKP